MIVIMVQAFNAFSALKCFPVAQPVFTAPCAACFTATNASGGTFFAAAVLLYRVSFKQEVDRGVD